MSITIQITQNVIDALSGETIITPEKIVSLSGQIYDENSDYIFEIKENITIPTGKTLKGFDNIVVNPTTGYVIIKNGGTIEDCIITLNTNDAGKRGIISNGYIDGDNNFEGNIKNCRITLFGNSRIDNGNGGIGNITGGSIILNNKSKIYNGFNVESNINSCIIVLNGGSEFYNGGTDIGNITGGSITLNNESKIYNGYYYEGNINDGSIILNDSSKFYNGYVYEGNINGGSIILNDSSKIYNGCYDKVHEDGVECIINKCTITLNDGSLIICNGYYSYCEISNSYIFLHDEAILQNFYDNRGIVGYGIVGYGSLKDNRIYAYDSCKILNRYNGESGIFDSIVLKFSDDCLIDKTIKIENIKTNDKVSNKVSNKDDTLSKLLLLSYLTQKDNSSVLQNLIK